MGGSEVDCDHEIAKIDPWNAQGGFEGETAHDLTLQR
jgi:hypothetical protein